MVFQAITVFTPLLPYGKNAMNGKGCWPPFAGLQLPRGVPTTQPVPNENAIPRNVPAQLVAFFGVHLLQSPRKPPFRPVSPETLSGNAFVREEGGNAMIWPTKRVEKGCRDCGVMLLAAVSVRQRAEELLLEPAFKHITRVNIDGTPSARLLLVLRTNGCTYRRAGVGCTMCGFHAHAVPPEVARVREWHLTKQFENALEYASGIPGGFEQIELLTLGSFLDDQEVSPGFRREVFRRIAGLPRVRKVVIESRAEYVSKAELNALKACLRKGQILQLGIGVESSSDHIRNGVIRKSLTWPALQKTVELCAQCGVVFQPYLLIKPHTLNEREAIEDAVRSAEDMAALAHKCGASFCIAFKPAFVTSGTALEEAYLAGQYEVLSLWSVVEVVQRTHHLGPIYVGGSDEGLSFGRTPRSCPACTPRLRAALEQFNADQRVNVFDGLFCTCKEQWEHEVHRPRLGRERNREPADGQQHPSRDTMGTIGSRGSTGGVAPSRTREAVASDSRLPLHFHEWEGGGGGGVQQIDGSSYSEGFLLSPSRELTTRASFHACQKPMTEVPRTHLTETWPHLAS